MTTNYEKYFGTPEKTVNMHVRFADNGVLGARLIVEEIVPKSCNYSYQTWVFFKIDEYLEWLQEEASE